MKESHGIRHVLLSSVLFLVVACSKWHGENVTSALPGIFSPSCSREFLNCYPPFLIPVIWLQVFACLFYLPPVAHKQLSASPGSLKVTQSLQDLGPLFLQE